VPSAPAFGLKIDRSILGALNVDFQQAMQTIAVLAGGNYSGLTYESGQVRNIYVQSQPEQRSDLQDVLSYYVRNRDGKMVQVSEFAEADLSSAPPVIILMTVPLAMLGALVFLAVRSIDLNIYAQVGLVTLIGLAAKNGILIVEVAEQHVKAGMSVQEAAMAAAESRMRPILMTAIASLAGFLPLVVATTAGANSQQSLGTVIFGGLLVATVLSLGVVPPFYVAIKNLVGALVRRGWPR